MNNIKTLLSSFLLLCIACGPVSPVEPAACLPSDCGDAPPMHMRYACGDGTYAGPTGRCIQSSDGYCGWEVSECVPPAQQACGARGLGPCPSGQFCDTSSAACGRGDQAGVCREITFACPRHYAPVCGCDGNNYSNTCVANSRGIAVDHHGPCGPTPGTEGGVCGGPDRVGCQAGLRCDRSEVAGCFEDAEGTCVLDEPTYCPEGYSPVCGCDGVTYSNDCFRRANGVASYHAGICRTTR